LVKKMTKNTLKFYFDLYRQKYVIH
jgi:hypothetical protein